MQGLSVLFTWPAFGLMLLGTALAVAFALLPGLGGGITVMAIVLPFIYGVEPYAAVALLAAIMGGSGTSGNFSATLFNVPGSAGNAATVMDAHPLAKQGQAGRALGAAFMCSAMGGVLGAMALGVTIPIMQPLVLVFASPERLMLVVMAIFAIGALAGPKPVKGLLSGAIGLSLSLIGMDPQLGVPRYTFGQPNLLYGMSLLPVIMGLFALPEMIDMMKRGRIAMDDITSNATGGVMEGILDCFRHWRTVLRATLIGIVAGILPGVGGSGSAFWAYAVEAQACGRDGKFGKGDIRGVIAPETANNAVSGGDMIPTVAFGIPGSALAAVMMAALMMLGIMPGPPMLGEFLPLTFFLTWTMAAAAVVATIICLLLAGPFSKISKMPANTLAPFIIMFVFMGSYIEQSTIMDVVVALLFGGLGYVMMRLDWPRSPLLVGFILGSLAERYFFTSYIAWGLEFFLRPATLALTLILVASVVYPFVRRSSSSPETMGQEG